MIIAEQMLAICDLRAANSSWRKPESNTVFHSIIKGIPPEKIKVAIANRKVEIREMEAKLDSENTLEIKRKGLEFFKAQCKLLSV